MLPPSDVTSVTPAQMVWMWQQKDPLLCPVCWAGLGCNWAPLSVPQVSAACGLEFTATIYFKGSQSWASGPCLGIEVSAVIFFSVLIQRSGGALGRCVTSEALILCASCSRATRFVLKVGKRFLRANAYCSSQPITTCQSGTLTLLFLMCFFSFDLKILLWMF